MFRKGFRRTLGQVFYTYHFNLAFLHVFKSGKKKGFFVCGVAIVAIAVAGSPAQAEILADPEDWPAAEELDNETCLRCHADEKLEAITERGQSLNLLVLDTEFTGTFHENLACVDCHQGAQTFDKAPHNNGEPLQLACA